MERLTDGLDAGQSLLHSIAADDSLSNRNGSTRHRRKGLTVASSDKVASSKVTLTIVEEQSVYFRVDIHAHLKKAKCMHANVGLLIAFNLQPQKSLHRFEGCTSNSNRSTPFYRAL